MEPAAAARSYSRAAAGNASRNIRAMPFPITPTSLTVFTNASAGEDSRLPCVNRIIQKKYLGFVSLEAVRIVQIPNEVTGPKARAQLRVGVP